MSKKKKSKPKIKQHAARNLHACHPIMKKGGVHEKSRGAKRAAAKKEMRRQVSSLLKHVLVRLVSAFHIR